MKRNSMLAICRTILVFSLLCGVTGCPARLAGGPSGPSQTSWDRVETISAGDEVFVRTADEQTYSGKFLEADARLVVLDDPVAGRIEVDRQRVNSVELQTRDSQAPWIGTAGGFLTGFVLEGVVLHVFSSATGYPDIVSLAFGGVGAGLGALTGILIAKFRDTTEVIYERPSAPFENTNAKSSGRRAGPDLE